MLHLRAGRAGISRDAYPDMDEFWADAARGLPRGDRRVRRGGLHLPAARRRRLRLSVRSEDPRRTAARTATTRTRCPRTYADTITQALEGRPAGMTITMHTCRGNFKSAWVAEGGYEPVAEAMFSTGVDAFFMEFDSARAGGFEPLRFVPKGKKVVLGLVSSKTRELGRARTSSSGASTRRRSTCRSKTCACRRSAASRARTTATSSPRTSSGASSSAWSRSPREVWH